MAGARESDQTAPEVVKAVAASSLKERQRQERESLILQAAMDLLIERGYHETSMDEIASRVGISKGAVYLHFASKEDLIAALLERGVRLFSRSLEAILSGSEPPCVKIGRVIDQIYGEVAGKRYQVLSAISRSPELYRVLAERRHSHAALWDEPSRRLGEVIEEGKRAGQFDATLPTPLVLSLLSGMLSPHAYHELIVREGMSVEDMTGHLRRFFFKGIAAGTPPFEGIAR